MITEIGMKSVASYKNITTLTTDKKINLIYGLNGTGKSTLSNYLYDPTDLSYIECNIKKTSTDPVLVYNQKFVQENFYTADKFKGIFSLSKENKEIEENIKKEQEKLVAIKNNIELENKKQQFIIDSHKQNREKAMNELWKIKSQYSGGDRVLEYCLDGLKGQKEKLFEHITKLEKPENEPLKKIDYLKKEIDLIQSSESKSMDLLDKFGFEKANIETNDIFNKTIIGNNDSVVSDLIDKLGNSDWVKKGIDYLPESISDKTNCPFCQELTIGNKFIQDIKEYFDETYINDIEKLNFFYQSYIDWINHLPNIEIYIEKTSDENGKLELIKKYQDLQNTLKSNIRLIEDKIKTPKNIVTLNKSDEKLILLNDEIQKINNAISLDNEKIKNKANYLEIIKNEFWLLMRWDYDQTISRYKSDHEDAKNKNETIKKTLESLGKSRDDLIEKISLLQKNSINIDDSINAINDGLENLGIDAFKIVKHSENLYRITRNGETSHAFLTLSEGEKMIISFLYFCELCKGRSSSDDTSDKRIAIIDDPISSLSHIYVFNIGQLIRSIFFKSDRFSQVFILTHSLYFFYEMTDINHDRRKATQKLFRLSKSSTGSSIEVMSYEEIQNDYQSYWSVVNDRNQPPALIANCMRNIVEYFFNFVRKKDFNNVFQLPELQDQKFQSFSRYVNRESHSIGQNIIDLKEFNYDNFKNGLHAVFKVTGYEDHYTAMSKL